MAREPNQQTTSAKYVLCLITFFKFIGYLFVEKNVYTN